MRACIVELVTPAKVGVQGRPSRRLPWIPAYAGMTTKQMADPP